MPSKVNGTGVSAASTVSSDYQRQQFERQSKNNYHSSSLGMMLPQNVNKTGLHPGGVEYVHLCTVHPRFPANSSIRPQRHREHTDLEEELHEIAHIDYNRVSIVSLPPNRAQCIGLIVPDCQSFGSHPLRRRSRVRDRFCHNLDRCLDGVLRCKNRALATGQAYRKGTGL